MQAFTASPHLSGTRPGSVAASLSVGVPTRAGELEAANSTSLPASKPSFYARTGFSQRFAENASLQPRDAVDPRGGTYRVKPGDTLSQIAQDRLRALGKPHGGADIVAAVRVLAASNGLADPDRIFAGSSLRLDALGAPVAHVAAMPPAPGRVAPAAVLPARASDHKAQAGPQAGAHTQFPVLERTLDRAVENGYLSVDERRPVYDRIIELSRKYRFSPDDFATVSLMESNGLNPRASNGRCFGIIQFCGGAHAGAAAVGMADQPQRIAEQPVLEQLDMVDRYFEHNGLQRLPQVGLVDLYLTILTPAAKRERAPAAPLPIAGIQARALYENQDRSQPITRKSILSGLIDHARQMLAMRSPVQSAKASGNPSGNSLPLAGNGVESELMRPG